MWTRREDMATTSLVAVREREWGFAGRVTVLCVEFGLLRSWKWRVESQEEDMRSAGCMLVVVCLVRWVYRTMLFAIDNRLDWSSMCT